MKKGLNKKDFSIEEVHGLEVLDSRGNPTVEVTVRLGSGASGKADCAFWSFYRSF